LASPGEIYVIYLKNASDKNTLDIGRAVGLYTDLGKERFKGSYEVFWFDPRNGGDLQRGTVAAVTNSGKPSETASGFNTESFHEIGQPPKDVEQDWVALVQRKK